MKQRTKKSAKIKQLPIPNKTLLRWVEENAPNVFKLVKKKIEKKQAYNKGRDIYHQDFPLVLRTIWQTIKDFDKHNHDHYLSPEMKYILSEIEETLN